MTKKKISCFDFDGTLVETPIGSPENKEKWDWSAGSFTKVFSNLLPLSDFHTLDLMKSHIERCKIMNSDMKNITVNLGHTLVGGVVMSL